MVPSCAMAGELKMMSPVAYDHLRVPSGPRAYSLSSCDPTRTEPSPPIAGDETMGPPVWKAHQIEGLPVGRTNGDRPRWVGPKRNIACADSTAYSGRDSEDAIAVDLPPPDRRKASAGQTQRAASHKRLSLQSLSLAQGFGSTWAQQRCRAQRAAKREKRRAWRKTAGDGQDVLIGQG